MTSAGGGAAHGGQDGLADAWRTLARFDERSVDLDHLPDQAEVREEADIAAWQAAGHLHDALHEVERLRGLLRELEWAGTSTPNVMPGCPVCDQHGRHAQLGRHEPDCWLAREIHPGQHEAPRP